MKGLSFYLKQVKDYRREQGKRISLPAFLAVVILANMSGFNSLKSLSRFFENNETYFSTLFGLKHGTPGYTQIRTILMNVDFDSLNQAFYRWASQFADENQNKWLNLDGKGMSSTISDYDTSYQNFHAMVSAFVQEMGINLASVKYESKKTSEIDAVRELIEQLEQKGMILTLDALHCQKKRQKPSWSLEMTM